MNQLHRWLLLRAPLGGKRRSGRSRAAFVGASVAGLAAVGLASALLLSGGFHGDTRMATLQEYLECKRNGGEDCERFLDDQPDPRRGLRAPMSALATLATREFALR